MRRIYTISVPEELGDKLEEYQKANGFETQSEGAIRLIKRGLQYDQDIEVLQKKIKELEAMQNQIHLPCSVCGKPMTVKESNDDPIYKDMKERYKNWGHSGCIESQRQKQN